MKYSLLVRTFKHYETFKSREDLIKAVSRYFSVLEINRVMDLCTFEKDQFTSGVAVNTYRDFTVTAHKEEGDEC